MTVLNGAGRTDDEERLVRWAYYLRFVVVALEGRRPPSWDMLVKHGYSDPTAVMREIEMALIKERFTKYPNLPPAQNHTDSSVSP